MWQLRNRQSAIWIGESEIGDRKSPGIRRLLAAVTLSSGWCGGAEPPLRRAILAVPGRADHIGETEIAVLKRDEHGAAPAPTGQPSVTADAARLRSKCTVES